METKGIMGLEGLASKIAGASLEYLKKDMGRIGAEYDAVIANIEMCGVTVSVYAMLLLLAGEGEKAQNINEATRLLIQAVALLKKPVEKPAPESAPDPAEGGEHND